MHTRNVRYCLQVRTSLSPQYHAQGGVATWACVFARSCACTWCMNLCTNVVGCKSLALQPLGGVRSYNCCTLGLPNQPMPDFNRVCMLARLSVVIFPIAYGAPWTIHAFLHGHLQKTYTPCLRKNGLSMTRTRQTPLAQWESALRAGIICECLDLLDCSVPKANSYCPRQANSNLLYTPTHLDAAYPPQSTYVHLHMHAFPLIPPLY